MALQLHANDQISFAGAPAYADAWARLDRCEDGAVAVDASGYPQLGAGDCRILAAWLLRQADWIDAQPKKALRKAAGRGRPKLVKSVNHG